MNTYDDPDTHGEPLRKDVQEAFEVRPHVIWTDASGGHDKSHPKGDGSKALKMDGPNRLTGCVQSAISRHSMSLCHRPAGRTHKDKHRPLTQRPRRAHPLRDNPSSRGLPPRAPGTPAGDCGLFGRSAKDHRVPALELAGRHISNSRQTGGRWGVPRGEATSPGGRIEFASFAMHAMPGHSSSPGSYATGLGRRFSRRCAFRRTICRSDSFLKLFSPTSSIKTYVKFARCPI
jgi:hypothetical protein